jgi:L-ascorbate metabolism protein UlaG (beta-lactamase superfamily)
MRQRRHPRSGCDVPSGVTQWTAASGRDDGELWLRPDVWAEPTVRSWYAWSYLLAPATSALYLEHAHLPLLESYCRAPDLHVEAARDPALAGGRFAEIDARHASLVRALLDAGRALPSRAFAVELDDALDQITAAAGEPLDEQRAALGPSLRGRVELVYDLADRADARILEQALYSSAVHRPQDQRLLLGPVRGDRRPFCMSTPRLPVDGAVELTVPFSSPLLDDLFRARLQPVDRAAVRELAAGLGVDTRVLGRQFARRGPRPQPHAEWDGPDLRLRYLGHASILLQADGTSVVTDLLVPYKPWEAINDRYSFQDLPARLDCVLISHAHQDHLVVESLLQMRHRIGVIVVPPGSRAVADPSMKLMLEAAGFPSVVELAPYESVTIGGARIDALPFAGEHGDLDICGRATFAVRLGGRAVYLAADSCGDEATLAVVRDQLGPMDALFIGTESVGAPLSWAYGGLYRRAPAKGVDESRRCRGASAEEARLTADTLDAAVVYVYGMGLEPWTWHLLGAQFGPESPQMAAAAELMDTCRRSGRATDLLGRPREVELTASRRR